MKSRNQAKDEAAQTLPCKPFANMAPSRPHEPPRLGSCCFELPGLHFLRADRLLLNYQLHLARRQAGRIKHTLMRSHRLSCSPTERLVKQEEKARNICLSLKRVLYFCKACFKEHVTDHHSQLWESKETKINTFHH